MMGDNHANGKLTSAIYALQALTFFFVVTGVIAVVLNHLNMADMRGSIYESHFRWQIHTFWYALLWCTIGILGLIVYVGELILLATAIWCIYRIAKGWLRLNRGQAMYVKSSELTAS